MGSSLERKHARNHLAAERQEDMHIQLLGGFQLTVGGRAIGEAEWRLRKARSLVKLLALAPNHQLHREQVIDTLWPDLDPQAASNNLRKVLHIARRAIESASPAASLYLHMQGDLLVLGPSEALWIDIEAFEAAAVAAHKSDDLALYQEAIRLYTGDLLPEDRYEDWTIGPREQLRNTYVALLVKSARFYEARGEFEQAIEALQSVIAADIVNEEAHVGLMRLYALAEQRHQALRQYGLLQEVLKRELDAEPEETAQHLYQEIQAGRFPVERPWIEQLSHESSAARDHNLPAQLTSFVGREGEIAEVKR
jgi:DNA-binding SARP family transcriptional activator